MKASNGNAKKTERKYCYTTKIFCSDHNVSYQRMSSKRKQTKPRWACGNYVKYRLDACESPIIAEMDLNNIFTIIMEQVFDNKNEIIKEMLSYYSNLKIDNNYQFEISKLKKEIKTIETKKEKLLELNIDGSINNLEFKERNDKYNEDISSLNIRIGKIEQERKIMSDSFGNIKVIEDAIKKQASFKNNVSEFVDKFLEEVIVYKEDNDRHKLMLKIYLNLLKKPIPIGKGARHIDDDKYLPIFTKEVETLDLGRADFQRNSFRINVYLSYDIDQVIVYKLYMVIQSFFCFVQLSFSGVTFKIITLATALEEKIVDLEKDRYSDSGSITVEGAHLHCWKHGGHGDQTYLEVVENSCNPGFVNLGLKLGKEKLFSYIKNFGFGKKTGVDIVGESSGILFNENKIGDLELATTAFGQGVSVTPIHLTV